MKKLIVGVLLSILIASTSYAAGVATATTEKIQVLQQQQRVVISITFVDDGSGTTFSIVPATYGIHGWYLYTIETNPDGDNAPTTLYDITVLDADGVDIAGGKALNRSATDSEIVNVGTSTAGYPMVRSTLTFTVAEAGASGTGVARLIFVAN